MIRGWSRFLLACCLAASSLTTGCVTGKQWLQPAAPSAPPVTTIATRWENRVLFSQDPVHQGRATPTLLGRVYLFADESGHPVVGDSRIRVELFDVTNLGPEQRPDRPIAGWDFDPATVQKFRKKDTIGEGYTLPLLWLTYRPDITRVQLIVSYCPEKGAPVYAPPSTVSLSPDHRPPTITNRQVVPGAPAPNPPGPTPGTPGMLPHNLMNEQIPTPQRTSTRIALPPGR